MPANFGVSSTLGGTAPTGGYIQSVEKTETCEVATIRSQTGVTVVAQPKGVKTTQIVVKSKGDVSVTGGTPGDFGSGKITSAKATESNDDFRTGEVTFTKYETL